MTRVVREPHKADGGPDPHGEGDPSGRIAAGDVTLPELFQVEAPRCDPRPHRLHSFFAVVGDGLEDAPEPDDGDGERGADTDGDVEVDLRGHVGFDGVFAPVPGWGSSPCAGRWWVRIIWNVIGRDEHPDDNAPRENETKEEEGEMRLRPMVRPGATSQKTS